MDDKQYYDLSYRLLNKRKINQYYKWYYNKHKDKISARRKKRYRENIHKKKYKKINKEIRQRYIKKKRMEKRNKDNKITIDRNAKLIINFYD